MKILYTGANLRQRRRETIQNPPKGVLYISQFPLNEMPPDHKLTGNVDVINSFKSKLILKLLNFFQYPNIRCTKVSGIDLIHTPGQMLINNTNYVVEIDNVACLSFYNLKTLHGVIGKNLIKFFLGRKNCRKIICISEAAKNSVINLFKDKKIRDKCVVSYPYVSDKHIEISDIKVHNPIKLLFISSDFYLKGGRETVEAFKFIKKNYQNVLLTIITKLASIDPEEYKLWSKIDGISFIEANLKKEDLYADYYLKSDIFVLPTYMDSFGLVFLEALSCGLAIITTNMFATPEMVIDGENGYILKSPINYFNSDYTPNIDIGSLNLSEYCKSHPDVFIPITTILTEKIVYLMENKNLLLTMKKASFHLYKNDFEDSVRKEKLLSIYLNSV